VKIKHHDKVLLAIPGDQWGAFSFNSAVTENVIRQHCALLFYGEKKSRHPAVSACGVEERSCCERASCLDLVFSKQPIIVVVHVVRY